MKNGTHFESLFPKEAWHDEITRIMALIKEGNSCQIVSLPGVGRSTLLRLLVYNTGVRRKHLGEQNVRFHFVLCNFSELASSKDPTETTKFLFLNLVESLRERRFTECDVVSTIFQESATLNDPLVLFAGLKRAIDFLTTSQRLTIVLLFDRFETYVPLLSDSLFANLQAIQEHASYRFTTVFSIERPLEEILDATTFPNFYSFLRGRQIFLRLSDPVGISFGLSHTEKLAGKKLAEEVKKEIIALGGGHAKMTTIAAEELLSMKNDIWKMENSIRKLLLENRAVRSVSYEIWETLTPSERKFLVQNYESGIMNYGEETSYLQNVGLLKDGKITIPFLAEFVRYRAQHPVKEKISLNSPLVDKLTRAEFRLLKFLLENQDRIVEREEVIRAVWSDLKSQAGITDQTLDQLVFRLRRKIEDDPNSPTHLFTIKGRGFRFTP